MSLPRSADDTPAGQSVTGRIRGWAGDWHLWGPCLLIIILAAPILPAGLPSTASTLTESYQPLKTLKFFHSAGQSYHKWGP
ncbi:MAG: hypothetical protein R3336_08950, partial [Phycisphaeraceae bacterium]|nr:hypothetical protein [Phycisphaeraceae bacterium]